MGGVCVILILREGQQSLTKLNAKQAAYMSESFSNLNIIYGSGRNSSFVIQDVIISFFTFFKRNLQNLGVA